MSVQVRDLGVRVGAAQLLAGVDLDCPTATRVAIIGPNGSGKSTLLRALYRAVRPTTGAVLLDGCDARAELSARQWAQRVAAVTQDGAPLSGTTVRDVVETGRAPHRPGWAPRRSPGPAAPGPSHDEVIRLVGLDDLAGREVSTLSGGERQRVQLARALMQQPRVLVLDEPTNHLDIGTALELLDLVAALPITVIAALHDLDLAAGWADAVHVLDGGRLVASGTPSEVLQPDLVAEVFGVLAHRGTHPATGRLHLTFSRLPPR